MIEIRPAISNTTMDRRVTMMKSYSSTMDPMDQPNGLHQPQEVAPPNTAGNKNKHAPRNTLSMDEDVGETSNVCQSNPFILQKLSISILLGGIVLGIILPKNPHLPTRGWRTMSSIIGYTYFLCWSASFYPQIFMNYQRKTTRGLSVDFCVLNVLGYICYTVYTTNFYWNERVIEAYGQQMSGSRTYPEEGGVKKSEITVQGNDVAFAIHALLMASFTLSQVGIYDTFTARPPSKRVYFVLLSAFTFCSLYLVYNCLFLDHIDFLGFLYVLGTIKVGVTIGKYVPQALLNRKRKSTVGWNVWNVLLDLSGGILSLLQLIGDCADMKDWTGITGNPAKIALALVTICFDTIFLIQHYILYADGEDRLKYSSLPAIESS